MDMQRAYILMSYLKGRVKEPNMIRQMDKYTFQHKNLKNQIKTYYVLDENEYKATKSKIPDYVTVVKYKSAYILNDKYITVKSNQYPLFAVDLLTVTLKIKAHSMEEAIAYCKSLDDRGMEDIWYDLSDDEDYYYLDNRFNRCSGRDANVGVSTGRLYTHDEETARRLESYFLNEGYYNEPDKPRRKYKEIDVDDNCKVFKVKAMYLSLVYYAMTASSFDEAVKKFYNPKYQNQLEIKEHGNLYLFDKGAKTYALLTEDPKIMRELTSSKWFVDTEFYEDCLGKDFLRFIYNNCKTPVNKFLVDIIK